MNIGQIARAKVREFTLGHRRRVLFELVNECRDIDSGDLADLEEVGWIRWCAITSDYFVTEIGREQLPKGGAR